MLENWFVVQTNPSSENTVAKNLSWCDTYLPKFKSTTGRIKPLFPSYLFVRATEFWSPIKNAIGVRTLLMQGEHPARLPQHVITSWKIRERNGLVQLPEPPRYRAGQRLVVMRGTLKFRTVIHTGMSAKDREYVLIEMLGHLVRININTRDLVSEHAARHKPLQNRRETVNAQVA